MTSSPAGETTPSRTQRIGWAVLILITLGVCYFSHLGVVGFVGPDEPRYAWIARDMAETGDWVTPRLYGKPWFEKPPLFYWGAAASFKLFGVSEAAARLPSAVSALLATLALAWLAWRTYGEECARWLLLLLPTTVGMIGFSHAAATDMPFAGMLTIAMVCATVALGLTPSENTPILPRTPWLALLLFGFSLGLAVLAKGPAAIVLSLGAVFFWAFQTKRWHDAFRLLHPAAIASFSITALPWYLLCARRNPDFLRIFILEHNFKRYLTPEFQHVQPFWFYSVVLVVAFLPWAATLVGAMVSGVQKVWRDRALAPLTSLLLCWSVFCVLFFTISKSKLPGYVLPAIPVAGLLFARTVEQGLAKRSRILRNLSLSSAVVFALAAGALAFTGRVAALPAAVNGSAAAASAVLFLFSLANLFLWLTELKAGSRGRMEPYRALGMVLPIFVVMLSMNRLIPDFLPGDPSGKTVAREILSNGIPSGRLTIDGMSRGMHFGLNFYLRQEIPDWDNARPLDGYLLLGGSHCETVVRETAWCEDPPIYFKDSQQTLYRVKLKTSLDGLAGGRQPKQEE